MSNLNQKYLNLLTGKESIMLKVNELFSEPEPEKPVHSDGKGIYNAKSK